MMNRVALTLLVALAAAPAAAVTTDVAVLPPQGATPEQAEQLATELNKVLALRGVQLTDPVLVARMIELGCTSLAPTCLPGVAVESGAKRLLSSRLTTSGSGDRFDLQLALFDAASSTTLQAPPLKASTFDDILRGLRSRTLELLQPGSQKGVVIVNVRGEGVTVSVDGVSSKIGEPISLGIGPHTLDIAAPGKTPASRSINVEADGAVEVAFCVDVDAVVEGDACAAAEKEEPMSVLAITGGVGVGVGGAALLGSAVFAALSGASADNILAARRDAAGKAIAEGTSVDAVREADGYATAAVATFAVGISLSILGTAALIAGTVFEETP